MIQVQHVSKKYKDKKVLYDLHFNLNHREVFLIHGRNGTGKTTTIQLLSRLIFPTSGDIIYFGDANRRWEETLPKIGVSLESSPIIPNYTAWEHVQFFSHLKKQRQDTEKTQKNLLSRVGLDPTSPKKAGQFSQGMKKKLSLALAFLGSPDYVFLDEPLEHLDAPSIQSFTELIHEQTEKHRCGMIITSNQIRLSLVALANQFAVLEQGRLRQNVSKRELERMQKLTPLELHIKSGPVIPSIIQEWLSTKPIQFQYRSNPQQTHFTFMITQENQVPFILDWFKEKDIPIFQASTTKRTIESFIEF